MTDCIRCRKRITGKYYTFGSLPGKYFCESCCASDRCNVCSRPLLAGEEKSVSDRMVCLHCYETLQLCSACGCRFLGRFVRYDDGTVLCGKCFLVSRECTMCGRPMTGPSPSSPVAGTVCFSCEKLLPRCDFHGGPVQGRVYRFHDGRNICPDCLDKVQRCHLCGSPCDKTVTIGLKRFCEDCRGKITFCSSCGRGMTGLHFDGPSPLCVACTGPSGECQLCGAECEEPSGRLPDGRNYCGECGADMCEDSADFEGILLGFVSFFEDRLGEDIDPGDDLEIMVVEPQRFELIRNSCTPSHSIGRFEAAADGLVGFFTPMPSGAAHEAVSHSYLHYAVETIFPGLISRELEEGFCRVVSREFLKSAGFEANARRLDDIRDIFDSGFRRCSEILEQDGYSGLLELLRSHCVACADPPDHSGNPLDGII